MQYPQESILKARKQLDLWHTAAHEIESFFRDMQQQWVQSSAHHLIRTAEIKISEEYGMVMLELWQQNLTCQIESQCIGYLEVYVFAAREATPFTLATSPYGWETETFDTLAALKTRLALLWMSKSFLS